jgi:2-hydroxyethylphosphonate dioxygenase
MLLPAEERRDQAGKTCATVEDARATLRRWGGYKAASMASAPHLPDLSGIFLHVEDESQAGDLVDCAECHFFVVAGELTFEWNEPVGPVLSGSPGRLGMDGAIRPPPLAGGRAASRRALGAHLGYLDWLG